MVDVSVVDVSVVDVSVVNVSVVDVSVVNVSVVATYGTVRARYVHGTRTRYVPCCSLTYHSNN